MKRIIYIHAKITKWIFCVAFFMYSAALQSQGLNSNSTQKAEIKDLYHYSSVFSAQRNYRIFLPPGYNENITKRYPVIYFFHGWAQRYFGSMGKGYSDYDKGDENNGDNIEKFVSENDVIVVKIDGLRFYHQDLNQYLLNVLPQYEFKVYETSHIACALGDMFDFIMKAFKSPLPLPEQWDYIDIYPFFEVWDYKVETNRNRAGFIILENVNQNGFKIAVRNFLPDGELMPNVSAKIMTSPIYKKNREYHITDIDLRSFVKRNYLVNSDAKGRLSVETNGSLHQIGISEYDGSPNLCMSKYSIDNMEWAETGKEIALSIQILNKGVGDAGVITGEIVALSDSLEVLEGTGKLEELPSLSIDQLKGNFKVKNNKPGVEIAKFKLILKDEVGLEWEEEFELRFKDPVTEITDFVIADGREMTVVKAAVDSFTGIVGAGNGDGIANPGETIVILVNEGGKYIRTNAYTLHPKINAHNTNIRISDSWQEYDHIGGSSNYTKPVISSREASVKDIWFYIEYWLPGNISGQHLIKKGKINIEVKGKDETPPQIQWLQILTNDRFEARVYDGSFVDRVALTFVPNEEKSTMKHVSWDNVPKAFEVQLVDTGLDSDAVKGDGVYSRKIENQPSYFYSLIVKTIDSEDNNEVFEWPEVFLLKNTK